MRRQRFERNGQSPVAENEPIDGRRWYECGYCKRRRHGRAVEVCLLSDDVYCRDDDCHTKQHERRAP